MRGKDLLECIEQIDDALVEEAMEPAAFSHGRGNRFRGSTAAKWGMAAACIVVLGVSATAFWSHQNVKNEQMERTDDDTAGYPMAFNSDVTGSPDSSLTAGAVDGDSAAHDSDTVRDEAAADGRNAANGDVLADDENIAAGGVLTGDENTAAGGVLTGGENAAANEGVLADGENATALEKTGDANEELCGLPLYNGEDAVSQSSAADAVAEKKSADVQDLEKAVTESEKLQYTIISDYYGQKDDSVYDYPVPEKGKVLCYHYLNETMKYYAALENTSKTADSSINTSKTADQQIYAYDIVIDVYGDIERDGSQDIRYQQLNWEETKEGNEMLNQEYMRLLELGYAVQLAEDFQLTGTLTKVEIDTFQALPEYGYVFRFADEY